MTPFLKISERSPFLSVKRPLDLSGLFLEDFKNKISDLIYL